MSEQQSYEVIVDGFGQAIDGALHLASICADLRWQRAAIALAAVRLAIIRRAGGSEGESDLDVPTFSHFTVTQAFIRHIEGLKLAIGGLRQMGVYHRKQEFWVQWAHSLDKMQRSAGTLLKRSAAGFLAMPSMVQ